MVNTSEEDYYKQLGMIALKFKPRVCLDAIADEVTGHMMNFLNFSGVVILYGNLSEKPSGGINTIGFIGKNLTLESFNLS